MPHLPLSRRRLVQTLGASALALPFFELLAPGRSRAASGLAERLIIFYFPDGVVGPSNDGDPSLWHATGSEQNFQLSPQLEPLAAFRDECIFFNGLTMGPTDSGSHPGGAKKLLTATDGGFGESIDHVLSRTAGADAPFRHVYLGAMANADNASGDKHISYPSPGQTITPMDDPREAFDLLLGSVSGGGGGGTTEPDPTQVTIIDSALDDMNRLRAQLGSIERSKLDLHLESLREVEKRIKNVTELPSCDDPAIDTSGFGSDQLYDPGRFPAISRAQIDLMVLSMSCGLSRVGVLQGSHHTSELVMSRFEGTPLHTPNFDMRSHQASHYGPSHDPGRQEYAAYLAQRQWWVGQFAYLLEQLALRDDPTGEGSMLDNSLVLLCTEVCDGNTHLHDDMPFVLAGRGGGSINPGRLLNYGGRRHADLLLTLAHAMGEPLASFGDSSSGPLDDVLA